PVQAASALDFAPRPFAGRAAGAAAGEPGGGAPTTLPETGVNAWLPILVLLGSGAALTGIGLTLRKRA
ncbi:MAG: LPXTG cell wall anchor domain-containing protein, partial [Anaerolineales bacterium]